jgi:hypothetical protein
VDPRGQALVLIVSSLGFTIFAIAHVAALVGDAAYCVSLMAGQGSALAMTGMKPLFGDVRFRAQSGDSEVQWQSMTHSGHRGFFGGTIAGGGHLFGKGVRNGDRPQEKRTGYSTAKAGY